MTTTTYDLEPVLVSELPPVGATRRPTWVARVQDTIRRVRAERAFERALREADPAQLGDLLALSRRR